MNKLSKSKLFVYVILISFIAFVSYGIMNLEPRPYHQQQDEVTETLLVERFNDTSALVTLITINDTYELYVEVEYPEENMTNAEVLEELIVEAIATVKRTSNF